MRGYDAGAGADDAEFLLGAAHGESRFVGEVDQRQVEGVAEFDQADVFSPAAMSMDPPLYFG